jgi:TPR repeat protein
MAPELLQALVRRGDAMLAIGDVSAARLLYERAADAGSGPAATAMGRSYDPAALAMLGVRGLRPDPEAAAFWYRRAMALGDPEAGPLARHLAGRNQERGPARRAE